MLQDIMGVVSTIISIYMFIIFVRIILTWVQGPSYGRAMYYLTRITDPYLNMFRGLRFLQIGHVDFSPVLAIILLSVVRQIADRIARSGEVSLGVILAFTLSIIASAVFFFLTLLAIITAIRLLGIWFGANSTGRFWITLDRILQPMTFRLLERFGRSESLTYPQALAAFAAGLIIVIILGRFLVGYLVILLSQLPF